MAMGYTTYSVQSRKGRLLGFFCAFDGSSHYKSDKMKLFLGKKRGQHCVPEEDLVVKVFLWGESSEKRCDQAMEVAAEVNRLAKKFSLVCPGVHISVVIPGKTQMDELTVGNGRKSQPLFKNQWVLVEDKLSGKFQQFTDESGVCTNEHFKVLEEFAHFVYQETGMVAGNLQGVCQDSGHFRLSSPTLHSGSQSLGPRDGRQEAVTGFFSRHCCSQACRHWLTPSTLQQRQDNKGRPPTPSAPIDITRGRATSPQSDGPGRDDIDFNRWSTVGPFGSPLSPPVHYFPTLPPYVSPSGDRTSAFHLSWQMGSPPPAYEVIPSAPPESDVTAEEKLYCPDSPPPYNEIFPGLET